MKETEKYFPAGSKSCFKQTEAIDNIFDRELY